MADDRRDDSSLYQVGGISALFIGVAYILIILLYIRSGAPPSGVEERLEYLARNRTEWWAIIALSVATDFLFIPVAISLYMALKAVRQYIMLFATACIALFVILDLAITWTNYSALLTLSNQYIEAVSNTQRMAITAASTYPSLVLESSLLFIYNSLVLAVGILMIGFVMLRGHFAKTIAYLGVVTGVMGVFSVVGPLFHEILSSAIVLTSILTTIWLLLVGYTLYRSGRE